MADEPVLELSFCDALQGYLSARGIDDKLYDFLESNCSELQARI
jgi:hypothetical protein